MAMAVLAGVAILLLSAWKDLSSGRPVRASYRVGIFVNNVLVEKFYVFPSDTDKVSKIKLAKDGDERELQLSVAIIKLND